ncbi:ShlB/FhaC/HecB family hemolysin secretion/activation protein, partial [Klebsiella michiganensis]
MNNKTLITSLSLYILLTASTLANVSLSNTNQVEQDKARQSAMAPAQQEYSPSGTGSQKYKLAFPPEATCRYIDHVEIISADHKLTHSLLGNIAIQAEKKCLGIEGIR